VLVALLTDTHFGARNDSPHFDDMFRKFYTESFFPYLKKAGITTLIHMGDVFDRRRYINFNILRSCREYFFTPLERAGITMHVIPGNHDVYFKNTNDINSIDLLLRPYDNIIIHDTVSTEKIGGKNFTFVPWITDDNLEDTVEQLKKVKTPEFCIGHFEFNGFQMHKGIVCEEGMTPTIVEHFDTVFTGHFHHRSSNNNIYYLGSPYEMIWSDFDDSRGFHILDTETKEITFIENPYRMFHKIYYKETSPTPDPKAFRGGCVKIIVEDRKDQEKYDIFLESLYAHGVTELTVMEDFSEYDVIHRTDATEKVEDTLTLLLQFVDGAADLEDNKDVLKSLIKTLYIEAQHLEQNND
jgi:DNA repair exonuclease SbcCD nuclease subunit